MLVVDASVALVAAGLESALQQLGDAELIAPPLMWSEAFSALHAQMWRGEVSDEDAATARDAIGRAPISRRSPRRLHATAWRLADELGLAKTYDAEYLALASLMGCRVVTVDGRLRRGADRLGLVVLPTEL